MHKYKIVLKDGRVEYITCDIVDVNENGISFLKKEGSKIEYVGFIPLTSEVYKVDPTK